MSVSPEFVGARAVDGAAARRERNLRQARALLEAVNAFGTEDFVAGLAEDVTYEAPYYRDFGVRCGRVELAEMVAGMRSRFDSLHYEVVEVFPMLDPDDLVLECRGDNVVVGSGVHYRNHYVLFLRFDADGLVQRWREFSNPDVYRREAEGDV